MVKLTALRLPKRISGFTIIEFMVATTVFSVVVLAVTYGIMGISRQYQRSMNISRTQAATRNLLDSVAQSVQYSKDSPSSWGPTSDGSRGQCASNMKFMYTLGMKKVNSAAQLTETNNALLAGLNTDSCAEISIKTSSPPANFKELLGSNMRLAYFSLSNIPSTDTYKISVKVAYGDDDLLCSPSAVPGSCDVGSSPMPSLASNFARQDLRCKSGAGSEYCAVSGLTTTVQKRL